MRAQALTNDGQYLAAIQEYTNAIERFEAAPEPDARCAVAYRGRGYCYTRIKAYDLAITDFERVRRRRPMDFDPHECLGYAYHIKGDLPKAIAHYERAIRLNQKSVLAHTNMGDIYLCRGEVERAASCAKNAIRAKRDCADAYILWGKALAIGGQERLAAEKYARGELYLGDACFDKNEFDQGIKHYSLAIKLKPAFPEAYVSRGAAYARRGRHDLAVDDCDKAIGLNPPLSLLAQAYLNRGAAYTAIGRTQGALEDLAVGYACQAKHFCSEGDYDRALASYGKAIAAKPNRGDLYEARAELFALLHDYAKAAADIEACRRLNHEVSSALLWRVRLGRFRWRWAAAAGIILALLLVLWLRRYVGEDYQLRRDLRREGMHPARLEAARMLGNIGSRAGFGALVSVLLDPFVGGAAEQALMHERHLKRLRRRLKRTWNPRLRSVLEHVIISVEHPRGRAPAPPA